MSGSRSKKDQSNTSSSHKKTKEKEPARVVSASHAPTVDPKKEKESTRRKQSKKWDEQNYHPKRGDRKKPISQAKGDVIAMRADRSTHFQNEKGETEEVKISVMVDEDAVQQLTTPYKQKLAEKFEGVPHYRPIAEIVARSALGSPLVVKTPLKYTLLYRTEKMSPLSFFMSFKQQRAFEEIKFDPKAVSAAFYESKEFLAIKKALEPYKQRSVTVTSASLKKSKAERQGKSRSQAGVMVKSGHPAKDARATAYVEATCIYKGKIRCEWLHLVPYEVEGLSSQDEKNIAAGTYDANTLMAMVEKQIRFLTAMYPDGLDMEMYAELVPDTHIATNIRCVFKANNVELASINFNAQTHSQPHITFQHYIRSFFEILVDASKANRDQEAKTATSPEKVGEKALVSLSRSQNIFYKKQKEPASKDEPQSEVPEKERPDSKR